MAVAQRMTEQDYVEFVLSSVEGLWELHDGVLVEKPGRTWDHSCIVTDLGFFLMDQLNRSDYRVFFGARVRHPPATIFVPDVMVVPTHYGDELRDRDDVLTILADPLPFVAEGWSPLEFGYDVDVKLSVYKERCDLEIWRIHPYERTATSWVRQPDGSYQETVYRGGVITLATLPGVEIDLERLFAV